MKSQHQIKFKRRRRPTKKHIEKGSKVVEQAEKSLDVVRAQVVIGERELQFARALSDTEKYVRDESLASLRSWLLENSAQLQKREIDRLWKGLFYCIWMADKRPIITTTIDNVVGLTDIVGWPFLEGLFVCLMREWFGIDRHRVDKFYELVNVALKKCVERVTQSADEFLPNLALFLNLLHDTVWRVAQRGGLGVSLHILDVYMDRVMQPILTRARALPGNQVRKVFDDLVEQPLGMIGSAEGHLHATGKRIQERILGRLIDFVSLEELNLNDNLRRDIVMRVSKRVFSVAARTATADEVRKTLYDITTDLKAYVEELDDSTRNKSE